MIDTKSQTITIIPFGYKIKAGGMFNLEELYQELQRWFTYNGFKWLETKYRLVENPDGGKQLELKWVCPSQYDDYISYEIRMDFQAFFSDVEANVDGVKMKLQKGGFEFRFGATYTKNWDGYWGKPPKGFKNWMKHFYEKVVIKHRIEDAEGTLFGATQGLFGEIHAYMKLYGTE